MTWLKQTRSFCVKSSRKILPLLLGVVGSIAILLLWHQFSVQEQLHVEQLIQQEVTAIETNLTNQLTSRIVALKQMTNRWQVTGGTAKASWEADAAAYVQDYDGYQAIEWVDSSFRVRWIVPLAGNEAAQNLDLSKEPRRRITLQIARDLQQPLVTRTIILVQSGKGFLVTIPLFTNNSPSDSTAQKRFDGFILGVFQVQSLFDSILKTPQGYYISVYDGAELIYSQGEPTKSINQQTFMIQAYGVNWRVEVSPTTALLSEVRSPLPQVVLFTGLISIWLFTLVIYLAQISHYRMRQLQQTNHKLQQEIKKSQQIETALEISQSRFAGILDIANDAIISVDANQRITLFNQGAEQIFGYPAEEVLEKPLTLLIPDRFADAHSQHLTNYGNTKGSARQMGERGIIWGKRKDGTEFPAEASISKLNLNGEVVFTTFLRDITDHKRIEEELRQAKEAAEAANIAKSIFLANMSHELRTPLNVILGFTQVMARDPSLKSEQREDLQTIQRSGDHLLSLINDILDLSKIEAGRFTLEETEFDLIALLDSLRSMFIHGASSKKLKLYFNIAPEVPHFIIADAQKLRQVLLNLLSNALKFTNQGSITLTVRQLEGTFHNKQATKLLFHVTDTGVGIATEELDSIFDAFVQAQAGKKSGNGTGLGLTISRKLLELMKGEISVTSTPGQGTTFTFTIPIRPTTGVNFQPEQPTRLVIGLAPGQPVYRILIVDDQRENRLLLVKLLTQLGLEVREATNGQEAVAHWQEWQPDLILMDIRMPVMDGYEATKQIRAKEVGKSSVIIALTAQASQSDRYLALAAGCNDYISKPFREETLFLKMAEYLGIEYIYAEANLVTDQNLNSSPDSSDETLFTSLNQLDITGLSEEWFTQLETAAICGDDSIVYELIAELPPSLNNLATRLTKLTDNFQFEQITELLETRTLLP